MTQKTEEKTEKTYTEVEVKKLLKKQVEACAKQIDAPVITEFTAKKKIREAKLAV